MADEKGHLGERSPMMTTLDQVGFPTLERSIPTDGAIAASSRPFSPFRRADHDRDFGLYTGERAVIGADWGSERRFCADEGRHRAVCGGFGDTGPGIRILPRGPARSRQAGFSLSFLRAITHRLCETIADQT